MVERKESRGTGARDDATPVLVGAVTLVLR